MKLKLRIITATFATFAALVCVGKAGTNEENLNRAYQAESNSANRYRQFARTADAENLRQTAKLFRAAAASEEIHRKIIENAILRIGGRVGTFELAAIPSGSTADNLRRAIQDETAESVSVYPGYLASAKAVNEKAAIRAFNYTLDSEKKLVEHFQQALDHIGSEVPATWYVCGDCGLMVTQLPSKKCPVCHEKIKAFKTIN